MLKKSKFTNAFNLKFQKEICNLKRKWSAPSSLPSFCKKGKRLFWEKKGYIKLTPENI